MQVNNVPVEPALYTVNDAKRLLSVSHTTLYRMLGASANPRLDVRKIGNRTLITAESIKRVIEQGAELVDRDAA